MPRRNRGKRRTKPFRRKATEEQFREALCALQEMEASCDFEAVFDWPLARQFCLSTLGRYRSLGQLTDKQAFKALELYQKWTSPEITGGPQQLATFHEDGDDGDS